MLEAPMTTAATPRLLWPNLFVVGAAKAGTTSLWRYLDQHPAVFMSPVKEPHFFSSFVPGLFPAVKEEEEYLQLFAAGRDATLRGEASPSYLWDPRSPAAIKSASPEAKIVIALRDPVERAYAFYWTGVKYGGRTESFLEAVRREVALPEPEWPSTLYVGYSLYADGVRRYLDAFGDAVTVIFFEELGRDTRGELRRLFARLGVDPAPADAMDVERHNSFALPRNELSRRVLTFRPLRDAARAVVPARLRPRVERILLSSPPRPEMEPEARRLLEEAFAPERPRLEAMLGRQLPW
jgi:hypothetical protein